MHKIQLQLYIFYFEIILDLEKICKNNRFPTYPSPKTNIRCNHSIITNLLTKLQTVWIHGSPRCPLFQEPARAPCSFRGPVSYGAFSSSVFFVTRGPFWSLGCLSIPLCSPLTPGHLATSLPASPCKVATLQSISNLGRHFEAVSVSSAHPPSYVNDAAIAVMFKWLFYILLHLLIEILLGRALLPYLFNYLISIWTHQSLFYVMGDDRLFSLLFLLRLLSLSPWEPSVAPHPQSPGACSSGPFHWHLDGILRVFRIWGLRMHFQGL